MDLMNSPSSSSSSSSPRENMDLQSLTTDLSPPSFSSDNKPILQKEKTLITQQSSNLCLISKSSDELKKEIASMELEIVHMERYLLSLYRKSFEQQLTSVSNVSATTTSLHRSVTTSPSLSLSNHYQAYEKPVFYPKRFNTSLKALSSREGTRVISSKQSLGELLGSSYIVDNNFINPNKLSEDIMKCISSIYCILSRSSTRTNSTCFSASPVSSMSNSAAIFSSKSDKWSLHCTSDDHLLNQSSVLSPGVVVIEALKVHLDDGSFDYAALMLQNFRSLVQKLEKVDLSRMTREEKLAFWINIHNALLMHTYLAYGTQNRARNTAVLKATYDIGGYSINPFIIQSSILGIRPHYSSPSPLLQTLLSPTRKSKTCNVKHIYALEYPEALSHFAISSGAFTDPTVRVYTADRIFRDLRQAKQEFIRSNVRVHKGTKIFLPKIFQYYVKDTSMDLTKLMETTAECLPKDVRRIAEKCLKEKKCKNIEWLPENLSFRYVIAGDLVRGRNKT